MKKRLFVGILIIVAGVSIAGLLALNRAGSDSAGGIRIMAADKSATSTPSTSAEMDPNMPGMTHIESAPARRPVSIVLGTFGFGVTTVFIWAGLTRRRERRESEARKKASLARRQSK